MKYWVGSAECFLRVVENGYSTGNSGSINVLRAEQEWGTSGRTHIDSTSEYNQIRKTDEL